MSLSSSISSVEEVEGEEGRVVEVGMGAVKPVSESIKEEID